MIQIHGTTSLAEFLGDAVVYRNLDVQDMTLPRFKEIAKETGLPVERIPRKSEPAYGTIVAELLRQAHRRQHPNTALQNLIFIGDTRMSDGTAFANICQSAGWQGVAFIGSENDQAVHISRDPGFELPLYKANRWALLGSFGEICAEHSIQINNATAVIFDLDKTSLGARGRNDKAIDQARTKAAEDIVESILGDRYDAAVFYETYHLFNQVEFHTFTTDNQDYLVYICLLACAGVLNPGQLADQIRSGSMRSFDAFANIMQVRQPTLPAAIVKTQADFYSFLQKGDATPFKAFRQREYFNTVSAMQTPESFNPQALKNIICITEEVRQFGLACKESGALLFGLSDKPDEASLPTEALVGAGYQALHRTPMLSVSLS